MAPSSIAWHTLGRGEVLKRLGTSSASAGLTAADATRRTAEYGPNILPAPPPLPALRVLANQFRGVLVVILIVAGTISAVLGDFIDSGVIAAALLVNVIVGFLQEYRASRAIAALQRLVPEDVTVIRDAHRRRVPAAAVVPGDILVLQPGDKVVADARVLTAHALTVSEALLTGEAYPVTKTFGRLALPDLALSDRTNSVFRGTVITEGAGTAIVYATGAATEFGTIAARLATLPETATPLQTQLARFGRTLGIVFIALAVFVFLVGTLLGENPLTMFTTAVALAVSAVPEGLLLTLTVILALGARRMLARQALVRRLVAAETLGSVTLIATDKTGTLTQSRMEVNELVPAIAEGRTRVALPTGEFSEAVLGHHGSAVAQLLTAAFLASDADVTNPDDAFADLVIVGTPTETAIARAATQAGLRQRVLAQRYQRLDEIPFTSARKYMAVLVRDQGPHEHVIFFKGAAEILLPAAVSYNDGRTTQPLTPALRQAFLETAAHLAGEGLRLLAVARRTVPTDFVTLPATDGSILTDVTFLGFIVLKDPLRPHVRDVVRQAQAAGVRTVLITGDHPATAGAIAKEAGLVAGPGHILTGTELAQLSEREFRARIADITVYARVSPDDKLRIVRAWRAAGAVVAMTGDGVNDAPAVQAADIGIAVGAGSDVVKETADLVLLDNNLKTIVAAIAEGRGIFDNLRKVIRYLLSDSLTETLVVLASFALRLPLPLLATQILWVNIVNDAAPSLALAFDPHDASLMKSPPRRPGSPLLALADRVLIAVISIITAAGVLGVFWWGFRTTQDVTYARTLAFALLGVDSLFYVYALRSLRRSTFRSRPFANRWLLAASAMGVLLQVIAIHVPFFQRLLGTMPLALRDWALVGGLAVATVMSIDIVKFLLRIRPAAPSVPAPLQTAQK